MRNENLWKNLMLKICSPSWGLTTIVIVLCKMATSTAFFIDFMLSQNTNSLFMCHFSTLWPNDSLLYRMASSYCFMCAMAVRRRRITLSFPRMSITSKMPGLTVLPVRATRRGWATWPILSPLASMME